MTSIENAVDVVGAASIDGGVRWWVVPEHSTTFTNALGYGSGVAAILLGLTARSLSPPTAALLTLVGGLILVALRLPDRWAWPWQHLFSFALIRARTQVEGIVGDRAEPARCDTWLRLHPDAAAADRVRVLLWLGRQTEAVALAPSLTSSAGAERYLRAWLETQGEVLAGKPFDVARLKRLLAQLDGPTRLGAEANLAALEAYTRVRGGRPLRSLDPPEVRGLSLPWRAWLQLWRLRLWPLSWAAALFLGTYGLLTAASFVVDR